MGLPDHDGPLSEMVVMGRVSSSLSSYLSRDFDIVCVAGPVACQKIGEADVFVNATTAVPSGYDWESIVLGEGQPSASMIRLSGVSFVELPLKPTSLYVPKRSSGSQVYLPATSTAV
jgi:hypothetical protein